MIVIETGSLAEDPRQFKGEEDAAFLELEHDRFFSAKDPAVYELHAQKVSSELVVKGAVSVRLSCRCARCDEWFSRAIHIDDFLRTYKLASENDSIDLTGDIREDILLALPTYCVCSPSCSGLCPRCGTNLNKQRCSCAGRKDMDAWKGLDMLNFGR